VSRVGTEAAVALWYNTARVSTLTHGNVLDASYAKSKCILTPIKKEILILNEKEKEKKLRKSAGSFRQSRIRESERGKRK
jgi:hypothetical protein